MKCRILAPLCLALVFVSGCKDKPATAAGSGNPGGSSVQDKAKARPGMPKPVERVVEIEADNHMNDAEFAAQIKDWSRAESSIQKAVNLRTDIPQWWINLGSVQKRLGKAGEAKSAYRKALSLHEKAYSEGKDPQEVLSLVFVHLLLNEEKKARSALEKGLDKHKEAEILKRFQTQGGIDALLKDPEIIQNRL